MFNIKFKKVIVATPGTVDPKDYDWATVFDAVTSGKAAWVTVSRGRLRGLAVYTQQLEARLRRRRRAKPHSKKRKKRVTPRRKEL